MKEISNVLKKRGQLRSWRWGLGYLPALEQLMQQRGSI